MTIWKIVKKIIRNCSLQKTPLVKKISTLFYKNLRNICLEQQLAKKLSRMQFAKKSCMIKTSGELRYTFLGRPSG